MAALEVASRWAPFCSRHVTAVASDLESFAVLLIKWQRVKNLVSRETVDQLWERHMADSLQLLALTTAADILDLGSGGGFPAIPLAIALKDRVAVTCVEPNSRKASFLRTVARELSLQVAVLAMRSDHIDSRETSLITARALAPLTDLCGLASRFFGPHTIALFHKGSEYGEEVQRARARWRFDVVVHPSVTDAAGVIVEISNLEAVTKA